MTITRGYVFFAYIVAVIDGDTLLVDPQIYPQDTFLRVRLRDVWEAEDDEQAKAAAKERWPVRSKVRVSNDRISWSHNRLVARVD